MKKSLCLNNFISRSYSIFIYIVLTILAINLSSVVFAQSEETSFSVGTRFPVQGETVLDGYIVVSTQAGLSVTTEAYQENQVGVVTERPAIEIGADGTDDTTYPVATSGEALVWVSLSNGVIKKGDPITSSPWQGVGMKATSTGPILGTAISDVTIPENTTDPDQTITKVRVAISPGDFNKASNMTSTNNINSKNNIGNTRLIVSGVIILATVIISLNFFGKLSRSGVEALGRNPLAFKKIEFGITINIIVGFLIALIGIAVAMYIIN